MVGTTNSALVTARSMAMIGCTSAAMLAVAAPNANAHAKFFAEGGATPPSSLPATMIIAAVTLGLLVAVGVRALAGVIHDPRRARCLARWVCERIRVLEPAARFVPVIARVALGGTLLLAASQSNLLAPHWHVSGYDSLPILLAEALLGTLLVVGIKVRASAACVPLLLVVAAVMFEPVALLERLDIVGLSLFVLIVGGSSFKPRLRDWEIRTLQRAAWTLRACVATALLTTALTEKLLHPGITQQVLEQYPIVDASTILPISQLSFITVMAIVEITFAGLVLLMPVAEITALVVAGPFIMTVAVFGPAEVVGHLPVWGAMVSLLLIATHSQAHRVVDALSPTASVPAHELRAPVVGERFVWSLNEAALSVAASPATVPAVAPPLTIGVYHPPTAVPQTLPPAPRLVTTSPSRRPANPYQDREQQLFLINVGRGDGERRVPPARRR